MFFHQMTNGSPSPAGLKTDNYLSKRMLRKNMFVKKLYTFRLDFEQKRFGLMLSHLNFECSEESAEWENGTFCDHKFIFEICAFLTGYLETKTYVKFVNKKTFFDKKYRFTNSFGHWWKISYLFVSKRYYRCPEERFVGTSFLSKLHQKLSFWLKCWNRALKSDFKVFRKIFRQKNV